MTNPVLNITTDEGKKLEIPLNDLQCEALKLATGFHIGSRKDGQNDVYFFDDDTQNVMLRVIKKAIKIDGSSEFM